MISTTSSILAEILTPAEIKDRVYDIVNKYSVRSVDSTAKLKDWCNRNLKILPSDFDLRARKTWENLKTLVERYDYQQEQEKRQDAALEEWEQLEETDTALTDEQQTALSEWQAATLAAAEAEAKTEDAVNPVVAESVENAIAALDGADLENANEFYPVRVLRTRLGNVWIAYAELRSSDWVVSHFALDGEVWTEYNNLTELQERIDYLTVDPIDGILPACELPDYDAIAEMSLYSETALEYTLPSGCPTSCPLPQSTAAPESYRAAIGRKSAAALNRKLAKYRA